MVLAAAIAPFFFYYQLIGRRSVQDFTWGQRFLGTVFNVNEFVLPVMLLLGAAFLLIWNWRTLEQWERRLVTICLGSLLASLLWVPSVTPNVFVRYVIMLAPEGALLAAWLFVRGFGSYAPQFAWLPTAILAITPWWCMPMGALVGTPEWVKTGSSYRAELSLLGSDVFGHRPDPNRTVIEWLRQNAAPTDEILVNYEDVPLMYYLPNPIRGGIAAFRAEDDSKIPPRFAVIRQSVPFVYWPVFQREIDKYKWVQVPVHAPDVVWGNNPDPMGNRVNPATARDLIVLRRLENPKP